MTTPETIILNSAYFGPVQYFAKIAACSEVIIEQYDSYSKQTYRNRCVIGGASGPLALSVPVKKKRNRKTMVKDIMIDYDTNWQKIHLRGLISCYGASPFFEFLRDDIEEYYQEKYKYLIDMNTDITFKIMKLLGIKPKVSLSEKYSQYGKEVVDYREVISPKISINRDKQFDPEPYHQAFEERLGFIPNLSILDLLFNTGQESLSILQKSNKSPKT